MVDEAPEHWDDLWKPEYKFSHMLFDGSREVGTLGLNSLLQPQNSKDLPVVEERVDKLQTDSKYQGYRCGRDEGLYDSE